MTDPTKVVFVCEHGSAKSVIAAAHFRRATEATAEDFRVVACGTNPDPTYPPHVLAGLAAEGLVPLDTSPRQLTPNDLIAANLVVTFCSLESFEVSASAVEHWEGIPAVSEDYSTARDAIVHRLGRLVASLNR